MATKLTNEIIEAAIDGFESQKQRIDARIAELRQMMTGGPSSSHSGEPAEATAASGPARKRRKMSAAGRKRIAEAQRKRWAEVRKETGAPEKSKAKKAKRRLSPEGRQRIIEATKKRWALARAAAAKAAK